MNTGSYYDMHADRFAERENLNYHRFVNEMTAEILDCELDEGRFLDAGCGCGHIASRLAGTNRRITGLDRSRKMLEKYCLHERSVIQGNAEKLPFEGGVFDGAYSMRLFPHLNDPVSALRELARVVRPGGRIVIDIYNPVSIRAATAVLGKNLPAGIPEGGSAAVCAKQTIPRYETVRGFRRMLPRGLRYERFHGIRVITPAGALMDIPGCGGLLAGLERLASRTALAIFGGFLLVVLVRTG